jgi:hypothetical protein
MMTNLTSDTSRPVIWFWQALIGIGIGPTFAVFTLIVQNEAPPSEVGVATGSLTFFQQIGGTIGLTLAGTIFASTLTEQVPKQLIAAGVPTDLVTQFASSSGKIDLTTTGDLGALILLGTPAQFRPVVQPLIPQIVHGIYEAVSLAVASTMWIGIAGALIAAVTVLLLREKAMRTTFDMPEAETASAGPTPQPADA